MDAVRAGFGAANGGPVVQARNIAAIPLPSAPAGNPQIAVLRKLIVPTRADVVESRACSENVSPLTNHGLVLALVTLPIGDDVRVNPDITPYIEHEGL